LLNARKRRHSRKKKRKYFKQELLKLMMKLMKKRKKKKKKYGQEHKIYLENKGNCSWKGTFYLGTKLTWNEGRKT